MGGMGGFGNFGGFGRGIGGGGFDDDFFTRDPFENMRNNMRMMD